MLRYALLAAALLTLPALAAKATPAEQWKASLKEADAAYATDKHAILKIDDAAYIHTGEFVSLMGDAKKPESWHWAKGRQSGAALTAGFEDGKAVLARRGNLVPAGALAKGIEIVPGIDVAGAPTQMAPGETGLRIMVYNQQNKAAKAFKGLDYFPYDPAWRLTAAFKPDPKFAPHVFRTSRGLDKQFYHEGDAVFTLQGKHIALPLYGDTPGKAASMTSFFTDRLTGKGAYHSGRYVDVEPFGKFPPATVILDFNNAYNPNCARSPFYNCPFAVDYIPLAVTAGEKDPHAH